MLKGAIMFFYNRKGAKLSQNVLQLYMNGYNASHSVHKANKILERYSLLPITIQLGNLWF